MSYKSSDRHFEAAMLSFCKRINSPVSAKVVDFLEGRKAFEKLQFDPRSYSEYVSLSEDYCVSKILSKWKGWTNTKVNPTERAYDEWYIVESKNESTNKRLRNLMSGSGFPGTYLISVISAAQSIAHSILGDFDVRKVLRYCRWGPGATSSLRRGTCRDQKMTQSMSTTADCIPYMKAIIESDPNWIEAITGFYPSGPISLLPTFWNVTDCSRLTSVPKTCEIDRIIDLQPTANGYLQQGAGRYMRDRLLLRAGIDLNSQETNQQAAFRAVFDDLSTLDLKSASDSATLALCDLLLPWQWVTYLHKLRTSHTISPKGRHRLQKISAMGNAFTFELETILFYSIARAVCQVNGLPWDEVITYGDDIIIRRDCANDLIYALNYFGFEINLDKSFIDGDFFESCGKHYFRSDDCTPIYQKSLVTTPEEAIRAYNRLVRWSDRVYGEPFRFEESLTLLLDLFILMKKNISFDKIPKIPIGSVSDDGFLFPMEFFSFDANGGYYTYVYRRCKQEVRGSRIEAAYLSLKLSSNVPNTGLDGRVYEDTGRGRFRLSRVYFYR